MNKKLALIALVPFAVQADPRINIKSTLDLDANGYVAKFVIKPAVKGGAKNVVSKIVDKKTPEKKVTLKYVGDISTKDVAQLVGEWAVEAGFAHVENRKEEARVVAAEAAKTVAMNLVLKKVDAIVCDKVAKLFALDDVSIDELLENDIAKKVWQEIKFDAYKQVIHAVMHPKETYSNCAAYFTPPTT